MTLNRRKFLLGASTFVIALKLLPSTRAFAHETFNIVSEATYHELVRIEEAFCVLKRLQFGPLAQSRMFGINPSVHVDAKAPVTAQRTAVIEQAIERRDPATQERIKCIEDMHRLFVQNLGPNIDIHLFWLTTEPAREDFKFRDRLETGELREMQRAMVHIAFWHPA